MTLDDRGVEDVLEPGQVRDDSALGMIEHLVRRAARNHASLVNHDGPLAQRVHLTMAVRDVDHRNAAGLVHPPEVVHDARLDGVVERGQRFVEQQHRRLGDERPSQRRSLAFAARDLRGPAVEDFGDAKRLRDGRDSPLPFIRGHAMQAVSDVLPDRHVRKERCLLKDVPDMAILNRDVGMRLRVEQHAFSNGDSAGIRFRQACEAAEQRGLSRPRGAEEHRDARQVRSTRPPG